MTELTTESALCFFDKQLEQWPDAAIRFKALENIATRTLRVGEITFTLQHNPSRIASTGAHVNKDAIKSRQCFLCSANRPPEQLSMPIINNRYELLINPFPIFPIHFTIPATEHCPQIITSEKGRRFAEMAEIAATLPGLALFFNGATCGASAPDHFHFQAVETSRMPLLKWVQSDTKIPFQVEHFSHTDISEMLKWFLHVIKKLPNIQHSEEAPVNIVCAAMPNGVIQTCIIPRRSHRPDFYGTGCNNILVSPATIDLCGTIILPRKEDFEERFTSSHLESMLQQTCFSSTI